ncbi:calcium-binding protein, partial [Bacillus velezensis]
LQEGNPGSDRITFGSSINQADLHYEAYGLDLIIRHINGADTVVVHNYFASTGAGGIAVGGTDVTDRGRLEEQLELPSLVFGTGGDDSMLGTSGDDCLYGADGNDTLMGLEGNDRLFGGGGDDLLIGGFGHDVLDGGAGNDIYHYDFGHGYDRIINLGSAEAGTDIIRIGPGLTRAMINNVQISGDDLMLAFFTGAGFQSLSLDGFLAGSNRSHIIEFDDGTWMSAEDFVETARSWNGTDGDDTYTATDEGNNLRAGAGNDIVHGQGGNDRIFGGEGDDQLFGGDGNDVIYGDGGADVLDGGAGDDMLYANEFGDGSPDILRGGAGNDRYYISTGYQYGSSPDTVIELEGEGVDTVF